MTLRPDPRGPNLHVGDGREIGAGRRVRRQRRRCTTARAIGDGCVLGDGAVLGKRPALGRASTARARAAAAASVLGDGLHDLDRRRRLRRASRSGDGAIVGDLAVVRERVHDRRAQRGRPRRDASRTTRRIGDARASIQAEAYITAYCTLEDDVFIAPCVVTTNDNFMGRTEQRRALMKGATIRRGARIGGGGDPAARHRDRRGGVRRRRRARAARRAAARARGRARPRATCATCPTRSSWRTRTPAAEVPAAGRRRACAAPPSSAARTRASAARGRSRRSGGRRRRPSSRRPARGACRSRRP